MPRRSIYIQKGSFVDGFLFRMTKTNLQNLLHRSRSIITLPPKNKGDSSFSSVFPLPTRTLSLTHDLLYFVFLLFLSSLSQGAMMKRICIKQWRDWPPFFICLLQQLRSLFPLCWKSPQLWSTRKTSGGAAGGGCSSSSASRCGSDLDPHPELPGNSMEFLPRQRQSYSETVQAIYNRLILYHRDVSTLPEPERLLKEAQQISQIKG